MALEYSLTIKYQEEYNEMFKHPPRTASRTTRFNETPMAYSLFRYAALRFFRKIADKNHRYQYRSVFVAASLLAVRPQRSRAVVY